MFASLKSLSVSEKICLTSGTLKLIAVSTTTHQRHIVSHINPFHVVTLFMSTVVLNVGGGWLWHCATSRMVAGSSPDGDIGIFH
jgi:hypothetical protein